MSNLSDIGFPVAGEQDVNQLLMDVLARVEEIPCPPLGWYYRFQDPSGAEIYLQTNRDQELIGFNPGFAGRHVIQVDLLGPVLRDTSELDGGFICRTDSGVRFVFDMPDFRRYRAESFPVRVQLELTAFASNDLICIPGKQPPVEYELSMLSPLPEGNEADDSAAPQAHAAIAGEVVRAARLTNTLSEQDLIEMSASTPLGVINVVADPGLLKGVPEPGDGIKGSFWLCGKIAGADVARDQ